MAVLLSPEVIASKAVRPTAVFFSAASKVPVVEWPTNKEFVKSVPSTLPGIIADTSSNKFNSAAVEVTAVPLIANLDVTILKVPLSSILATSVPSLCWKIISLASTIGLIITSLDEFVIFKTSVPPALKLQSFPAASKTISPSASSVISPEDKLSISAIFGVVNVLFVKVCVPVNVTSPTFCGVIFVNEIESESKVAELLVVQSQRVLSLVVPWLTTTICPDISAMASYSVALLAVPELTTV